MTMNLFSEITCPSYVTKEENKLEAVVSGTEISDTILLKCVEGYTTNDNSELVCSESGEWIGQVPECRGAINNGTLKSFD